LSQSKVNKNNVTYELTNNNISDKPVRAHHYDLHPYKTVPSYIRIHRWFQGLDAEMVGSSVDVGRSSTVIG